jgi:hypothetical protein
MQIDNRRLDLTFIEAVMKTANSSERKKKVLVLMITNGGQKAVNMFML